MNFLPQLCALDAVTLFCFSKAKFALTLTPPGRQELSLNGLLSPQPTSEKGPSAFNPGAALVLHPLSRPFEGGSL